ncbi:rRNA 2'-O-methyltransferase fibrillarin [Trifolium repens]|nr:rRNA 2'-O-methyltransferase fibrillarin [Trifolium repens]
MLINLVDVLFAALDRPEQGNRAYLNAMYFLKTGGHYMLYAQGNCIESTNRGDGLFSYLMKRNQVQFQRMERVTLEPFDRDHAYVRGVFRMLEIAKIDQRCLASHKFWTYQNIYLGVMRGLLVFMKRQRTCPHICCLNRHADTLSSKLVT